MKLLILFVIAFSVIGCSSDGSSPSFIVSETAPSSDHMKAFTEALEKFVDVSEDPNNIRYDLKNASPKIVDDYYMLKEVLNRRFKN